MIMFTQMSSDDTKLNVPFDLNDPSDEVLARHQRAEACILEIKSRMSVNEFKLNDEKSEFLIMTSIMTSNMTSNMTLSL